MVLAVLLAGGVWLTWRSTSSTWRTPAELARAPLSREVPALSIIVLPLTLEGETTDAEWLADALHGDLVIAVAQLQNSFVIARDTASTYKGKAVDPRQVAREMGVRHVVQGSLRQEASKIRLNLTLTDGESGVRRWSEAFDTDRAQLAQAVSDFAVAIERTLVAELTARPASALQRCRRPRCRPTTWRCRAMRCGIGRHARERARSTGVVRPCPGNEPGLGAGLGRRALYDHRRAKQRLDRRPDPPQVRRAEEAAANLQRLDRDGNYTYSSKTFLLFIKRDFRGCCAPPLGGASAIVCRWRSAPTARRCCSMGALTRRSRCSNVRCASGPGTPFARSGSTGSRWRTSAPAARAGARVEPDRGQHHSHAGVAANSRRRAAAARPPRQPNRRSTSTCATTRNT